MRVPAYGRVLFGASSVLFGALGLAWRDADMWQNLAFLHWPQGDALAVVFAVLMIAGGLAMLVPKTARYAAMLLGAVYAFFTLIHIPGIVTHPRAFGAYDPFFEWLSLTCGAVAVLYATPLARIGLGLCAIVFTLAQAIYLSETARLVPKWIPPNQTFWAIATTVLFALAAIAILVNFRARTAILLMTLMIALFGALVWVPILVAAPQAHVAWSEFALTFLIAGASWIVAERCKDGTLRAR